MEQILSAEVRKQITHEEMEQFARETARTIVIRSTINGNSNDVRRDTSLEEADAIRRIIYGALCNIRYGRDIQATADAAEFIGMQFLPGTDSNCDEPYTNTYDTIYLPIKRWAALQEQQATA